MLTFTPELQQFIGNDELGSFVRRRELVDLDGVLVDVEAILRRRYRCDCTSCLQVRADGKLAGDCCDGAEVRISAGERRAILAHLPGMVPYMEAAPRQALEARLVRAHRDPSRAYCAPVQVEGQPSDLVALRRQPGGACIFRSIQRKGGRSYAVCAIHSYLLERGLPLWGIKPITCLVWPLAVAPLYDGHILLTVHSPETYLFTFEGYRHASRPCLLNPPEDAPLVYQSCGPDLRHLFGARFYERLCAIAAGEPAARWTPAWGQPALWPA
ncbi:MAG TPA: hypothetical protein PLJ35_15450 [Anaerolineae bacterium]|nr:hypothetical protein [Anaerolineae bacterium]HOR00206.1 hypothetical protein [Anaerolineae bacterium]HPL28352.1 hypothetical protein [Anaerolineae bacterium]